MFIIFMRAKGSRVIDARFKHFMKDLQMTARLPYFLIWREVPTEKLHLEGGKILWRGVKKQEGFEIDYDHQVISFVPARDDYEIPEYTPIVDYSVLGDVPVWSIFRGKWDGDYNVAPMIYAWKGINNWAFKDFEPVNFIEKMFDSVIEKYINAHSKEVTVVVPNGKMCYNFVTERILAKADEGLGQASNGCLIEGRVHLLFSEQVYNAIEEGNSKIRALYGRDFNEIFHKLGPTVGEEVEGLFDRNTILDKDVRDAVDLTLKHCREFWAEDANKINGRHVLILGNPMGGCRETINDVIKTLKQSYAPKSVTVLQMVARYRSE